MTRAIIIILATALILTVAFAATEPNQPLQIKTMPLIDRLTSPPKDFVDMYGDTVQSRLVYSVLILRSNDLVIAQTINKLHPADPNKAAEPAK